MALWSTMTADRPTVPQRALTPAEITHIKRQLRDTAMRLRATLATEAGDPALVGQRLAQNFLTTYPLAPGAVISGYWPDANEIDVRPLLISLLQRGHKVVLPVIVNKTQPLRFRQWWPGTVMASGRFGIPVPPDNMPEMKPDVVLTPLLAFDRQGYRLGRGSGLYDRTLATLRASGRVVAVGIGFAGQELSSIPHHAFDQRLDWMVTESGSIRIGNEATPQQVFGGIRGGSDGKQP